MNPESNDNPGYPLPRKSYRFATLSQNPGFQTARKRLFPGWA